MKKQLRAIPAVEKVIQKIGKTELPRPALVTLIRRELAKVRKEKKIPDHDAIMSQIRGKVSSLQRSRIQPVINGTGVVIHTNLGRSVLPKAAQDALQSVASQYNTLEYDLTTGERGSRGNYLEHNLAVLCGAEAATVVNNCAAALVLILHHFVNRDPNRKQVVINRGELVQIGGGFRIPEILESSGAVLREVGTTNKTSIGDYAKAIGRETAMVLKVHRSNFFMSGFTESPETAAISALARKKKIPFVEDLGSGAVVQTEKYAGCEHEPTPAEILKQGVDLVCFSGDKLLGGPQAGVIAGNAKLVAALKRNPLFRALRCDKLILSALEATVDLYLSGQDNSIPNFSMLQTNETELFARAQKMMEQLTALPLKISVGKGNSQIGGGTLPRSAAPSVVLEIIPQQFPVAELATRLRLPKAGLPVIGYVSHGRFKIDLRTVFATQDAQVVEAIRSACIDRLQ
ncbi:MAG: L-seryl-tRNA(Sec) selenium transferase [Verrucomicrobiales bacterium]|nr:L-seryl-tRNA(Sec) selenium transferase [Verrucomicrobiales bacterium]